MVSFLLVTALAVLQTPPYAGLYRMTILDKKGVDQLAKAPPGAVRVLDLKRDVSGGKRLVWKNPQQPNSTVVFVSDPNILNRLSNEFRNPPH